MNTEENLKTTPSKGGSRPGSSSSPSTRSSTKRATKNAKITNFFTKVNSPLARNSSNSNADMGDSNSNGDASSSSMKAPCSNQQPLQDEKNGAAPKKDYVFIVPSSDDDTNLSTKNSQSAAAKRKRPPSVHSSTSKSSDGLILTTTNNGELGIGRKKRVLDLMGGVARSDSSSNQDGASLTPTRCSSRDSTLTPTNQTAGGQKINRIQPTMIGCRTKTVDFQSVPSDLNLPREQAEQLIEQLFLVKMPEDFYLFWDFAKTINHRKPCSAFSLTHLDWNLVGPYDVLSGLITDFHGFGTQDLLRHCRFYYDTPEFQTVIIKRDEQNTHYGYFRDEPSQNTAIVVANKAAVNGDIHEAGDNLFTLLRSELESSIASLSKPSQEVPTFSSSSSSTPRSAKMQTEKQTQLEIAKAKQELTIIRDKLLDFCSSHENLSTDSWQRTVARRNRCSLKTVSSIGLILPKDENINQSDGSRLSEEEIAEMLQNIADSRCPASKMLELGLNLFYRNDLLNYDDIEKLLVTAYTRLGRSEFAEIVKAHLGDRKPGDKVSLLD